MNKTLPSAKDMDPNKLDLVRFWSKVEIRGTSNCWIWRGTKAGFGYGGFNSKEFGQITAHFFSFRFFKGEVPHGQIILHACNEPRCVNPAHLSLGSHGDNARQMVRDGRCQRHRLKVTDREVLLLKVIGELDPRGTSGQLPRGTVSKLSAILGVDNKHVSHLVHKSKRGHYAG